MEKQTHFVIGFFAALLLSVCLGFGAWGATGELAEYVAVMLFGAIIGLVLALIFVLTFRDAILRRLLGRGMATLNDVTQEFIGALSAASAGDRTDAEKHATKLGQAFAGWYSWTSFYRWVIATALGFLVAFGAFTGTVLLFEQNRKLAEQTGFMQSQTELMQSQTQRLTEQTEAAALQNEIMTLELVSQLRAQMLETSDSVTLGDLWSASISPDAHGRFIRPEAEGEQCGLALTPETLLKEPPSAATLAAIEDLGRNPHLGARIVEALEFLIQDTNDAVAFGALMVLDRLGAIPKQDGNYGHAEIALSPRMFSGLYIDYARLSEAQSLSVFDSVVSLHCEDCQLHVYGSIASFVRNDWGRDSRPEEAYLAATNSLITSMRSDDTTRENTIHWLALREETRENAHRLKVSKIGAEIGGVLEAIPGTTVCEGLKRIGNSSPLFSYVDYRKDAANLESE